MKRLALTIATIGIFASCATTQASEIDKTSSFEKKTIYLANFPCMLIAEADVEIDKAIFADCKRKDKVPLFAEPYVEYCKDKTEVRVAVQYQCIEKPVSIETGK